MGNERQRRRPLIGDQSGTSLIEVLVAVAILSILFVGVLTGMGTSIKTSDYHKQRTETENVLLSGAELVKKVPKVPCATASEASYLAAAQEAATEQGWDGSRAEVTSVRYWDGTTYGTTCYDNATNRLPLQEITIEVTHPGGRVSEALTLVKGVG